MPKFISIPKVIDAEQYTGDQTLHGVCTELLDIQSNCYLMKPHVHTAHDNQRVFLEISDWIVPEPNGKGFYPIKNDIFVKSYRPFELPGEKEPTALELGAAVRAGGLATRLVEIDQRAEATARQSLCDKRAYLADREAQNNRTLIVDSRALGCATPPNDNASPPAS